MSEAMRGRLSAAVVLLALTLVACSGGTNIPIPPQNGGPPAAPDGQGGTPTAPGNGSAGECRHGPACAPGLIDELASVPLPESADEFGIGSAEPDDPRGSARQSVYFLESPAEITAFYEEALPAAGFEMEIDDSAGSNEFFSIEVATPDGHEGALTIRTAVPPHGAQMGIELYIYR